MLVAIHSPTGTSHLVLSESEVIRRRKALREQAINLAPGSDHTIYYTDERDAEDRIIAAHLYYEMVCLDDKEFYAKTKLINGYIGSIHNKTKQKETIYDK